MTNEKIFGWAPAIFYDYSSLNQNGATIQISDQKCIFLL